MQIRFLILFCSVLFFLLSPDLHAQEAIVKRSTVVENYKGSPYFIHFVAVGESLSAIAKEYQVTSEEIINHNPALEKGIKPDMVLRIPQKSGIKSPEKEVPQAEEVAPSPPVGKTEIQNEPKTNPDYIIYKVKKQETLYGISKQYGLTVDDILNANPGFTGLNEGMEIKIPSKKTVENNLHPTPAEKIIKPDSNPEEIVVKTGETLYSIAKSHNTTVDDLIDLNPQLSGGLKAGMVIRLRKPVVKPAPETVADEIRPIVPKSVAADCYKTENADNTYQIALLLPLLLEESSTVLDASETKDPSGFESFNYFQFYAGFKLAADSLERLGLKARIQVYDAEKLNDTLQIRQTLRKSGMDKMDLIVGPVYANSFAVAARFARKNEIGIVNPLSHRESIVEGNPFVVKTQVSSTGIASKLTSFIVNTYPNANVIAVRNDAKEFKALFDDFKLKMKAASADHSFGGSLQEAMYSTEFMSGITKKFKPGVKNIVVFFSNHKTNVPNFVSLLNPSAKSGDVILVGLDGWDELGLETEFLVNLNFHQVSSGYIDYDNEAVAQFVTRFRDKYGAMPLTDKYAFLGFDIGWYFLTSLMWYGDQYLECIPGYTFKGLQYNFDFSALKPSDGFQNQNISVLKLEDYKMIKVY